MKRIQTLWCIVPFTVLFACLVLLIINDVNKPDPTPTPTVTITALATESAIETPAPNKTSQWVKVAEMTTSSSDKKGAIFEVVGEKQKFSIDYKSDSEGAGATIYIFAKGDNSDDGYTEMFDTNENGSSSSLVYLDPGEYYLNLCVFGGKATGTFYDYR